MAVWKEVIDVARQKHPRLSEKYIQYGTAGFRTKGADLDHVMYRMGALAVLRSKVKKGSIGVMITASHNPEEDNGVKLVDPMGDMLEVAWEGWATRLANAPDAELGQVITELVAAENIDLSAPGNVVCGRDTRPSSPSLAQAVRDGIAAAGGVVKDYGVLTTPQLHYLVCCINTKGAYGQPTEEGYNDKLAKAFLSLRGQSASNGKYQPRLHLDGANGVGGIKIHDLIRKLDGKLEISVLNDGSSGKLNHMCGADHVKVQQKPPVGMSLKPGMRAASLDGDADRLVYFYVNNDGKFCLMDGDKIATLIAGYLKDLVTRSGLTLNLGLVQTAYANGSSTNYIKNILQMPVECSLTGVKHLHHKALAFDVGVYFEANGHGTVLFSKSAQDLIKEAAGSSSLSAEQSQAAKQLQATVELINQTVGDALSDMLVVETVLHCYGWSTEEWNKAYTDLPNRQTKIKVADRTAIETTDAERQTTAPAGLQEAINALVAKYPTARSFVRPSGTEDVVRVYAEADTQANADQLAYEVGLEVYRLAGGVGDKPSPP